MPLYLIVARTDGTLYPANRPKSEVHEFDTDNDAWEWLNNLKYYEATMMRLPDEYGQTLTFIGYKPGKAGENSPNYRSPVRHDEPPRPSVQHKWDEIDGCNGSDDWLARAMILVTCTLAGLAVVKIIEMCLQ